MTFVTKADHNGEARASPNVPGPLLIAAGLSLTGMADFLFYQSDAGWTWGLFAFSILAAMAGLNPRLVRGWTGRTVFVFTMGLCAALIEYPSPLTALMLLLGLATFAISGFDDWSGSAVRWAGRLAMFGLQWLPRAVIDAWRVSSAVVHAVLNRSIASAVLSWLLPVGLSVVFVALFYTANPIIASWLDQIDWRLWSVDVAWPRFMFWLFTATAIWPFIRARLFIRTCTGAPSDPALATDRPAAAGAMRLALLSQSSVTKSLLLFNGLFALQNGLDAEYLWRGAALPDGLSFASYAHQSVYPLIATALLAAVFVLAAFPAGHQSKPSRLVSALMVMWVAQNVFLVASSMQRTALYVDAYSLTYLRVAAMIWMALVATGLVWIVFRIALSRSTTWLINANVVTLLGVLYACCFIDFGAVIANHNVRHCREMDQQSAKLDLHYLKTIGPSALPALKWLSEKALGAVAGTPLTITARNAGSLILNLEQRLDYGTRDWRAWTLRWHRLRTRAGSSAAVAGALPEWPVVRP